MRTSHRLFSALLSLGALVILSASALAADPGTPTPAASAVSDQKAGSVLFYNAYTSNATAPATANSRINITNTSSTSAAFVHLFFVDGSTCSVADNFICLTPNQTASFLASDVDPGVSGYIVAIAVDHFGRPTSHNFLIGDVYIRYATGHSANLGAEAFAALYAGSLPVGETEAAVAILFNNVQYNAAPFVLASSSVPSALDGNNTLLIINRVGGDLRSFAGSIGSIFGLFYDDAENVFSYNINTGACQFRASFSNTFPRLVPRFDQVVPAGRTGWTRFWSLSGFGLLGAQINFNPNAAAGNPLHPGDFSGGRNLHKLTFTTSASYVLPIIAPSC